MLWLGYYEWFINTSVLYWDMNSAWGRSALVWTGHRGHPHEYTLWSQQTVECYLLLPAARTSADTGWTMAESTSKSSNTLTKGLTKKQVFFFVWWQLTKCPSIWCNQMYLLIMIYYWHIFLSHLVCKESNSCGTFTMFDPSVDIYYDEKCKNDLPSLKPWEKKTNNNKKKQFNWISKLKSIRTSVIHHTLCSDLAYIMTMITLLLLLIILTIPLIAIITLLWLHHHVQHHQHWFFRMSYSKWMTIIITYYNVIYLKPKWQYKIVMMIIWWSGREKK